MRPRACIIAIEININLAPHCARATAKEAGRYFLM